MKRPTLSVVIPLFNEHENLAELRRRLNESLEKIGADWEVIFVDDGSRDETPLMLRKFHTDDARYKTVTLSRNFGHQPAITAGVHIANGQSVILMDGDLQDPPEVIPQLLAKWREGNPVVLAERTGRAERGARGLGFKLFYPLLRKVSDLPAPDAGIFGLMDRRVVDQFNKLPERNRFIPGLRTWLGFRPATVSYERHERAAGQPKQSLRKLIHYAMDGMISFSYKPLRWVSYTGFCVAGLTFLLALFYLAQFIYRHGNTYMSGFTTTIMCILFLGGVQLISIGILGEYIGRIYEEVKQRPLYVIEDLIGFENSERPA